MNRYTAEILDSTWYKLNAQLDQWSTQSAFTKMPSIGCVNSWIPQLKSLSFPLIPTSLKDDMIDITENEAIEWACEYAKYPPSICCSFLMKHKNAKFCYYKSDDPEPTPMTQLILPVNEKDEREHDFKASLREFIQLLTPLDRKKEIIKAYGKQRRFYTALLRALMDGEMNLKEMDPYGILDEYRTPQKIIEKMEAEIQLVVIDTRAKFQRFDAELGAFVADNVSKNKCITLYSLGYECEVLLVSLRDVDYVIDCLELQDCIMEYGRNINNNLGKILDAPDIVKIGYSDKQNLMDICTKFNTNKKIDARSVFYPIYYYDKKYSITSVIDYLYGYDTVSLNYKQPIDDDVWSLRPLMFEYIKRIRLSGFALMNEAWYELYILDKENRVHGGSKKTVFSSIKTIQYSQKNTKDKSLIKDDTHAYLSDNNNTNKYYNLALELSKGCNVDFKCILSKDLAYNVFVNNIPFPPTLEIMLRTMESDKPPFMLAIMASLNSSVPHGPLLSQFNTLDGLFRYLRWGKYKEEEQGQSTLKVARKNNNINNTTPVESFLGCPSDPSYLEMNVLDHYNSPFTMNLSLTPIRVSPINILPSIKSGIRPLIQDDGMMNNFYLLSPVRKTPLPHQNSPPTPEDDVYTYPQTPLSIQQASEESRHIKKMKRDEAMSDNPFE